ncbi:MAG TPA: dockerin type I repeat-containing protein [Tepidisphaeraceae bacterium]|nr:dockerin type I repeat-containing protein [Tepidisphaeraceae bacterium]
MVAKKNRRASILALVPLAALCPSLAKALEFNDNYIGPNNGNYSLPANWDLAIVPNNAGPVLFNVTIPAGGTTVNFDKVTPDLLDCTVQTLNLGKDSTFQLLPGTKYTVQEQADIYGVLKVNGGQFMATTATLKGDRARISIWNGAAATIGITSYSSTGLTDNNGYDSVRTFNWDLMTAADAGTVLDLSGIQSIDAGYGPRGNDYNRQFIRVSGGALLDLSGVKTVKGPTSGSDYLEFTIADGASLLRLGSLDTITSAGAGFTRFNVQGSGASLTLNQLKAADRAQFIVVSGATAEAHSLLQIINSTFALTGGSAFHATAPGASYSSTGLTDNNGYDSVHTFNWDLMTAADAGTVLDLSGIQSINAAYAPRGNDRNYQYIRVSGGAQMNLAGVKNIVGPQYVQDYLQLVVSGNTSVLKLDSLKDVSSSGGRVYFTAKEGASLLLPHLSTMSNALFQASGGSTVGANQSQIAYSSKGLTDNNGYDSVHTFNWDLMTAADAGTVLDLSGIRSIDAGYGPRGNDYNRQFISVSKGARIDLSGVRTITTPQRANDWLQFNVQDALLDLSGLRMVSSAGNGPLVLSVSGPGSAADASSLSSLFGTTIASAADSAQLALGDLKLAAATTLTLNKATVTLAGLRAPKDAPASTVTLNDASDCLEITNSLALGSEIALSAPKGATISVGRDFAYQHTDEKKAQIGSVNFNFTGSALQQVEVGGLDIDVFASLLTNDNFGLGRVTVGAPNQPTIVELRDDFDNGNRGGQPHEALYIFGPDGRTGPDVSATNALQLTGGSHLVLHNLNAYARQGPDGWVRLQDLLKPGDRRVAYGDGFISRTLSDVAGAWDVDSDGAWSNQNSWFQPQDAKGNAIFGSKATAPRTITVDQPAVATFLAFDNANAYTLTGPAAITLAGPRATIRVEHDNGNGNHKIATELKLAADLDLINNSTGTLDLAGHLDNTQGKKLLKTGPGLVTLTGPQSHGTGAALVAQEGTLRLDTDAGSVSSRTASLEAAGGRILLTTSQHVASLYAFDGTIELAAGHNKVIVADDVSAGVAGKVDLMDNALIVRSTASERDSMLQLIVSQARASYAASKHWQGPGLSSSTAAAFPKSLTGLAVLLNDDGKGHTLRSQIFGEPATLNDILAIYTWNGDVNLDGKVNLADYFLVDAGFITQKGGYRNGDLNYDGKVDLSDYFLIDSAFIGQTTGAAVASTPVPEPGGLLAVAVLAGALAGGRRRFNEAERRSPEVQGG